MVLLRLPLVLVFSTMARLLGLLSTDRFAIDMSAVTLVTTILLPNRFLRKSNKAFCIISVTSYPFSDGPQMITGLIDGTTSYGGVACG